MLVPLLGNSAAFPGNRRAGFNPATAFRGPGTTQQHWSAVALGSSGSFRLLSPTPLATATVTGSPTSVIDGFCGPVSKYTTSGATSFAGPGTAQPAQLTFAAILTNAISATATIVGYVNATPTVGLAMELASLQLVSWNSGSGSVFTSGLSITTNTPYFLACSIRVGAQTWLIKNLRTGALSTASSATGTAFGGQVLTNFQVGGTTQGSFSADSNIAAAYMGYGVFLGIPELMEWSNDPWSFWYPHTEFETLNWLAPPAAGFPVGAPMYYI